MIKYICSVCGYTHDGDTPPESCPQCQAPESKFRLRDPQGTALADEHRVGIVDGIDPEIIASLRQEFQKECSEVGTYLAMARQADREGYPEVAESLKRIALEEAEHAAKFAELLGEVLFADTQKNLDIRMTAELADCETKKKIATLSKQLNLDGIHDTVHEMSKDEARHYKMLEGLRGRYF